MTEHERGYQAGKTEMLHLGLPTQHEHQFIGDTEESVNYYRGKQDGTSDMRAELVTASPDGTLTNYYAEGTPPGILGTRAPYTRTFGPMP